MLSTKPSDATLSSSAPPRARRHRFRKGKVNEVLFLPEEEEGTSKFEIMVEYAGSATYVHLHLHASVHPHPHRQISVQVEFGKRWRHMRSYISGFQLTFMAVGYCHECSWWSTDFEDDSNFAWRKREGLSLCLIHDCYQPHHHRIAGSHCILQYIATRWSPSWKTSCAWCNCSLHQHWFVIHQCKSQNTDSCLCVCVLFLLLLVTLNHIYLEYVYMAILAPSPWCIYVCLCACSIWLWIRFWCWQAPTSGWVLQVPHIVTPFSWRITETSHDHSSRTYSHSCERQAMALPSSLARRTLLNNTSGPHHHHHSHMHRRHDAPMIWILDINRCHNSQGDCSVNASVAASRYCASTRKALTSPARSAMNSMVGWCSLGTSLA